jgi:hypothetical protein
MTPELADPKKIIFPTYKLKDDIVTIGEEFVGFSGIQSLLFYSS